MDNFYATIVLTDGDIIRGIFRFATPVELAEVSATTPQLVGFVDGEPHASIFDYGNVFRMKEVTPA